MSRRSLFIAAYDVASDSRRHQMHRAVKAYATGGQKSVFECFLTPMERQALWVRGRRLIDEREDRFAVATCRGTHRAGAIGDSNTAG